jgi:hypothetical protein
MPSADFSTAVQQQLPAAQLSVISQFDGPMIKVGDGCRAIKTLEIAQKTAWQKEVWRLICRRAQIVPRRPL